MPRAAAAVTCRAVLSAMQGEQARYTPAKDGFSDCRQFVSVAMLPAALRAISPKAVTICSMFSGA